MSTRNRSSLRGSLGVAVAGLALAGACAPAVATAGWGSYTYASWYSNYYQSATTYEVLPNLAFEEGGVDIRVNGYDWNNVGWDSYGYVPAATDSNGDTWLYLDTYVENTSSVDVSFAQDYFSVAYYLDGERLGANSFDARVVDGEVSGSSDGLQSVTLSNAYGYFEVDPMINNGWHEFCFVIDEREQIMESDETDNEGCVDIYVYSYSLVAY